MRPELVWHGDWVPSASDSTAGSLAAETTRRTTTPELHKEVISRIMDGNGKAEGMENFMQSNNVGECECGAAASVVAAFRCEPRIMCAACYTKKSLKFLVSEEFCVDALEVIQREQSLKPATLARLRRFVQAHWRDDGSTR